MNKKILQALFIQTLGPILLFGLSIGIGRFFGPSAQGSFATSKALLDLLVAFGSFGLPQSVILAINREGVSRVCLYHDAIRHSMVMGALFVPAFAMFKFQQNSVLQSSLLFALCAASLVLINIWRGILLTIDDGIPFHFITIIPVVSITLVVSLVLFAHGTFEAQSLAWIFAAAGVIALLFSVLIFPPRRVHGLTGERPDYKNLFANGGDVFIQAMAISVQSYCFLAFLAKSQSDTEAGYFSLSLTAFQALLMPLQMLSPMILNIWSKQPGKHALMAGGKEQFLLIFGATGLIILSVLSAPQMIHIMLGKSFDPAVPAVQITILSALPALLSRIINLRLTAVGHLRLNSILAVSRLGAALLALLVGSWLGRSFLSASTIAATAWLLAEVLATILAQRLLIQRILAEQA